MDKKIYLVDGNSFIYRMFFALPEFSTKDGIIVNALFGMAKFFVNSLVKENPDYLLFIKDAKGDNFRHKLYADYKSTREKMPDNLRSQIKYIEEMIGLMGIDILEIEGYEADDLIGTLATKLSKEKNNKIYILSGDKDLYSLIKDNVFVYDTMKKIIFDYDKAYEKFGIKPNMIIDYLAIVGDKSDNIPGIDGFGPKKAIDLINIIGNLDEIYDLVDKIESGNELKSIFSNLNEENLKKIESCFKGKTYEKLLDSRENAFLSKKLATIELNIDLDNKLITNKKSGDGIINKIFDLNNFKFNGESIRNNEVNNFFNEFEFLSLLGENEKELKLKTWSDLGLKINIIQEKKQLDDLYQKIKNFEGRKITLDTETTSLNIIEAELVGVSIYIDDNNIFYINRLHKGEKISDENLKNFLKKLLNLDILIIGHNIKYDLEIIELFLNKEICKNSEILDNDYGQMTLDL